MALLAPARQPIGAKLYTHLTNEVQDPAITWNEFLPMIEKIGWQKKQAEQLKTLNKGEFMAFCSRLDVKPYINRVEGTLPDETLPVGMKTFIHIDGLKNDGVMTWMEFERLILRIGWDRETAIQLWHIFDTNKNGVLSKDEFLRFANHKEVVSYIIHLEQTLPSTSWFLYGGKTTTCIEKHYVWPYQKYEKKEMKVVQSYKQPAWYHEICERSVDLNMCTVSADALRKAMKGIGTNNKKIIKIMADKSTAEVQAIRKQFAKKHKRDLLKDFKSETSGNFDTVLSALTMDKYEYDASLIRSAVKGVGTNEEILIEVLCTRSPDEISRISARYSQMYKKSMSKDIKEDTSKDFQQILLSLCEGKRSMGNNIDDDADRFYKAATSSDVSVFIDMLTGFSRAYIEMINNKYKELHDKSLSTVIGEECKGDVKKCLQALCIPIHEYLAEKIRLTMQGLGTKDNKLIRLVVSQKERHLRKISKYFFAANKKSLLKWVKGDTSGNYGALLAETVHYWGDHSALVDN